MFDTSGLVARTAGVPGADRIFAFIALLAASLSGCSGKDSEGARAGRYVLGSVVIDADGNRTTYVQTIASLDGGPFDNRKAIELPGNGVLMAADNSFYVGLTEAPVWIRYSIDGAGKLSETGRLSFLNYGASSIDYGNVIVDAQTAVSVFSKPGVAVVWDPSSMKIRGEISLTSLLRDGYELEVWTTVAHNGLVYIPGRWSDWEGGRIYPEVSTTIIDPKALSVLGTARDERCASGGRVVFDGAGYAYVLGDGRNYSIRMFANASGGSAPANCLLRMAPGAVEFDANYFYTIESLSNGLEAIGELETAQQGSGIGFSKFFYRDKLPVGVEPVDFAFWSEPAHKLWRIEFGEPPTAKEVGGAPFSAIGFSGSALGGYLYTGESPDGSRSDVYEIDPENNTAALRFTMDGYFNGVYELTP